MVFRSENELEKASIPFLKSFFKNYKFQVPFYNRVIDAVGVDKDGEVYGIEYKLRDWKKAVYQACRNRNAFDYAYIMIPGYVKNDNVMDFASAYGVGVMLCDYESNIVDIELNAKKESKNWPPNKNYIKKYVGEEF